MTYYDLQMYLPSPTNTLSKFPLTAFFSGENSSEKGATQFRLIASVRLIYANCRWLSGMTNIANIPRKMQFSSAFREQETSAGKLTVRDIGEHNFPITT